MKTHFLLPFPVNHVGECVRTAPYTDPDHARCGAQEGGEGEEGPGGRRAAAGLEGEGGLRS